MVILYDKVPHEARPLVDCLNIIEQVGEDKNACLERVEREIEETRMLLQEETKGRETVSEGGDGLLEYLNRLLNARTSFIQHFA